MVAEDVTVTETLKKKGDSFQDAKFEDFIDEIGGNGKFQFRLNVIFICFSVIFVVMSQYSKVLAVTVPDHWCHVPGRETNNYSKAVWKNITIPREGNSYSKCFMYKSLSEPNETIPCLYGWDYDDTWFSATAASQENWVCDKGMYANTSLSMTMLFSILIGVSLFYVGDRFGRRKQFISCLCMIVICRGVLPLTPSIYILFIAVSIIPAGAGMPSSESSLSIGIELCSIKHRSAINFQVALSYALGTLLIALLAWFTRDWIIFVSVPALLCCIPLLLHRYLPESPRWLVAKGQPEEALKVLQRVALTNGRTLQHNAISKLKYLSQQRTVHMGVKTIFMSKKLFKNTVILIWSRSAAGLAMFTLLLNAKSFGGNPFVPYIGQAVLQMPAITFSHYVGNKVGRRCTHTLTELIAAGVAFLIICFITVSSAQWMITTGSLVLQFCIQASFSLTNLQSLEIHPTCVRQISVAMEYVGVSLLNCAAPYIAYLGTDVEPRYMFAIVGAVLLTSSLLLSFLPESLNEKLPETLEDAELYGSKQKYWRFQQKQLQETEVVIKLQNATGVD